MLFKVEGIYQDLGQLPFAPPQICALFSNDLSLHLSLCIHHVLALLDGFSPNLVCDILFFFIL